ASQYLASKLNGVLITDDFKALEMADKVNIYTISTLTLLDYAKYYNMISNIEYLNAKERLSTVYFTAVGEYSWKI
ncbi:MAG: hypothetical protein DRN04_18605, partial [Thermoprotei archaeon]